MWCVLTKIKYNIIKERVFLALSGVYLQIRDFLKKFEGCDYERDVDIVFGGAIITTLM